ncbi:hypothetical protein E2C01_009653 [Portunus trituberculatus]|uniref:Uncharacterized protein n=1 Tax=Portunus trituberculatus TaxID=210409 RepID=A0A5B7D6K2_PORTR|nr:hypothetical protein [Portunus trituberculatus]
MKFSNTRRSLTNMAVNKKGALIRQERLLFKVGRAGIAVNESCRRNTHGCKLFWEGKPWRQPPHAMKATVLVT